MENNKPMMVIGEIITIMEKVIGHLKMDKKEELNLIWDKE